MCYNADHREMNTSHASLRYCFFDAASSDDII